MKIAVFGSAGRTGRHIVDQGLKEGHEITAFVHRTRILVVGGVPGLVVVSGDVLNNDDVQKAIANQEAVISVLGTAGSSRLPVVSQGTKNIINAMKMFRIERLIVQSAHGAGDSSREMSFVTRLVVRGLILRNQFADKDTMEKYVEGSSLAWTIVRPTRLTNGPKTGILRTGEHIPTGWSARVSRADVARFALDQLQSTEYIRKAPTITRKYE